MYVYILFKKQYVLLNIKKGIYIYIICETIYPSPSTGSNFQVKETNTGSPRGEPRGSNSRNHRGKRTKEKRRRHLSASWGGGASYGTS